MLSASNTKYWVTENGAVYDDDYYDYDDDDNDNYDDNDVDDHFDLDHLNDHDDGDLLPAYIQLSCP